MTPKEAEFMFSLIAALAQHAHEVGYVEAKEGKPLRKEGFTLSAASRLTIKTFLKKHTENR